MADADLLLQRVKTCLRSMTDKFDDDEIIPLISSAYDDMSGAGVIKSAENKVLMEQAVIFYCRAYFGLHPDPVWVGHYEALRDSMALRKDCI